MAIAPAVYTIRIRGRVEATALAAFPTMVSEVRGDDTVLTGLLADGSAVFGMIAQIEALGLELLELRDIRARPRHHECTRHARVIEAIELSLAPDREAAG